MMQGGCASVYTQDFGWINNSIADWQGQSPSPTISGLPRAPAASTINATLACLWVHRTQQGERMRSNESRREIAFAPARRGFPMIPLVPNGGSCRQSRRPLHSGVELAGARSTPRNRVSRSASCGRAALRSPRRSPADKHFASPAMSDQLDIRNAMPLTRVEK